MSHAYWEVGNSIVLKARYLVDEESLCESLCKNGNAGAHMIAREEMMKDEALMEEFLAHAT